MIFLENILPPPLRFFIVCAGAALLCCQPALAQETDLDHGVLPGLFTLFAQPIQPDYKKVLARAESEQDSMLSKQVLAARIVIAKEGPNGKPLLTFSFVMRSKIAMCAYPRSFLCLLLKNNCHVYLAPSVVDADPMLLGKQPLGYPAGNSYYNCRAVFSKKGIMIGSSYLKNGKLLQYSDPTRSVQHEIAHAVDQFLGRPSLSPKFMVLYRQEREAVSVVDRAPIAYYLQPGNTGAIETFAQLLAYKYCRFSEHHTLTLVRCFPRCLRFIDENFPPPDQPAPQG